MTVQKRKVVSDGGVEPGLQKAVVATTCQPEPLVCDYGSDFREGVVVGAFVALALAVALVALVLVVNPLLTRRRG